MTDTSSYALHSALGNLAGEAPLRIGAEALLNALGYNSQRTAEVGSVQEFLERFASEDQLTEKQRSLFNQWNAVEIVFQFTADEITLHPSLFENSGFDCGRIESFLFVAVDLVEGSYSRTRLAEMTRAANRLFAMPVILLFRYDSMLTLATIHRRAHKRDDSKDVLDKVTLVKDICLTNPHRAHIKILSDLEFSRMVESNVRSFDEMQAEWERMLDIETLNKHFYRELFSWFERAVDECHFPDDGAGEGGTERHVIRLITRLLFIWFLKEKDLVPEELFEEQFARSTLTNYAPDRTDYYRAVLQNLFFATLNTEINGRLFATKRELVRSNSNQYRYRDLLANPDAFVESLKKVPFVNGGLFDCLDDFAATGANGRLVDAFSDDPIQAEILCVPARLFLDENGGLFELFRHYKFTVEENTPLDHEVALDPELLGRVFENLLAAYNPETRSTARKATGSYYTPRPVVDYMVREALAEVLSINAESSDRDSKWWRERIDYLLDHASEKADAGDFFETDEKREIVSAIAHLRALDPAVGSGAFPMGILQTLTLALRRLDPDNVLWEEIQKERAKTRAEEAFDIQDQSSRDEALLEISVTFQKYRKSDFGRKLYLIQNGIYGVDIQPIACQIAKLRFFISLVIEQDSDPDEFNLGIKPLPNLETRFVAADTLIGLERSVQMQLGQTEVVQNLERELATNREQYFHAADRREKLRLQENDSRLRADLADELKRAGFAATAASNIAHWDPFDQNTASDWFEPEYMFGESDGFDVVIGNPPYIQLQKNSGHAGNLYRNAGYETFAGTGDIYQLFYERGCELLKPAIGTLTYITSNSWLKAEYGRNLRQYFANQHTPLVLIEMGKNVFENAIVDTAVLIVRNGKNWPVACRAVDVEQASDNLESLFPPPKGGWGTLQPKGDRPWMTLSSVERTVLEKMEAVGTPLGEWDISIHRGILTGYNAAFVVDQETRDALVKSDPNSVELLKPILRGRDIARYRANWAGLWLISTFPPLSLDIDRYPAIKRHLSSFGKGRLAQEGRRLPGGGQSRKKTPNAWYELQDTCAYYEKFRKPKLFWMHMSPEGRFALGEPDVTCNQKCFMITGENLHYLCAILNSTLVTWLVSQIAVTTGMGLPQWDKFTVERVPVIHPNQSTMDNFRDHVDSMLAAIDTGNSKKQREVDSAIDKLVFDLYDLTSQEVHTLKRKGY